MDTPQNSSVLQGFISEAEYAAERGVSLRTCQRNRQLRQAPPYIVVGRQVLYRVEAIREWLVARERHEDRSAGRRTTRQVGRA
ncbi:MAG: hypothetical protein JNM30_06415 [Rhodospirillales bacterium]|nr:hypothetical protein [Rhodospirillales bacterium]